nr:DUF1127 domain-containing protein [Erwinia piriflorinigrans]
MEFEQNRAAKPLSWMLIRTFYTVLYHRWRARRLRACTRKILSRLNDSQLKDIGLTDEDIRHL